jgi:hypothetical protein
MRPKLVFLTNYLFCFVPLFLPLFPDRTGSKVAFLRVTPEDCFSTESRPKRIYHIDGKTRGIQSSTDRRQGEKECGMFQLIQMELSIESTQTARFETRRIRFKGTYNFVLLQELCWPFATAIARGRTTLTTIRYTLVFSFHPPTRGRRGAR